MNVRMDATRVTALLDKTVKALPAEIDKALAITAQQGTNIILDHTEQGRGYLGSFKRYSVAYAKFRAKNGRQISPVNLNYSGRMLSSISNRKISKGVQEIYFTRAEEARKAYFNNQTRAFFGFTRKEKSYLRTFFQKALLK